MILNTANIANYLVERNLINKDEKVSITPLKGGNINILFLVQSPHKAYVLKQAFENAAFKQEITLTRERIVNEKNAMLLWKKRTGSESIPKVYYFDERNYVLVMEAIPYDFEKLTYSLIEGKINLRIAKALGQFLADIHNTTYHQPELKNIFRTKEIFTELKMKLFHKEFIDSVNDSEIKKNVQKLIQKCYKNQIALVHGDTNPKNILVKENRFYVLDYEIANIGDPAHDLGNLIAHYVLAGILNYPIRKEYYAAIDAILEEYRKKIVFKSIFSIIKRNVLAHIAPIIYGRVFGTANVNFIDEKTKKVIRNITLQLAKSTHRETKEVFKIVDMTAKPLEKNKPLRKEQIQGRLF